MSCRWTRTDTREKVLRAAGVELQVGDDIVVEAEVNRHKQLVSARLLVDELNFSELSYKAMVSLFDEVPDLMCRSSRGHGSPPTHGPADV